MAKLPSQVRSRRAPRRSEDSRSRREWGVRVGLSVLLAIAGYYSTTFSLAQVTANASPEIAHRLAPYDGQITAAYAAALAAPQASAADREQADRMARLALRRDPATVAAVSTLGLDAQIRGDVAGARRLFSYAQILSRRDLKTQLWSIEDAVSRASIPDALRWYDAALLTNPQSRDLLFPILVSASDSPAIRSELTRTLARRPLWGEAFIKFAAGNSPDPRSTAILFDAFHRAGVGVPESAEAGVIDALARKNQYDVAWAYYASSRPGISRGRSRDASFAAQLEQPTQFDWTPINGSDVNTYIRAGSFYFAAPAGAGGPLLWQRQVLAAGRYRLEGRSADLEQSENARPYWLLSCQDGRELGRLELPNSSQSGGRFAGFFDVPAGCPVQTLTLVARPTDTITGLSGRIDHAELTFAPASGMLR